MAAQSRTKVSDITDTIADIVYVQYGGEQAKNKYGMPLFPPGVDINNIVHLVLMLGDAWEEKRRAR